MARIQYTSYRFNTPLLISRDNYTSIKSSLSHDPKYNPFQFSYFQCYYEEFKVGIMLYLIGSPTAILLFESGVGFFEIIAVIYGCFAFGGLFGSLKSTFSFFGFLNSKQNYYTLLMRNLKSSIDYNDFKEKMTS